MNSGTGSVEQRSAASRREFILNGLGWIAAAGIPQELLSKLENPTLYAIEGQTVFPVYGPTGAMLCRQASYLMVWEADKVWTYGYDPLEMEKAEAIRRFRRAIDTR
jgi:hypothetical protein